VFTTFNFARALLAANFFFFGVNHIVFGDKKKKKKTKRTKLWFVGILCVCQAVCKDDTLIVFDMVGSNESRMPLFFDLVG
jgi:hypothetical protein